MSHETASDHSSTIYPDNTAASIEPVPNLGMPRLYRAGDSAPELGSHIYAMLRETPQRALMEVPVGNRSTSAGNTLYRLTKEIDSTARYRQDPLDQTDYQNPEDGWVAMETYGLYLSAADRLERGTRMMDKPRYALTRKIIKEAPSFDMEMGFIEDRGCFQAEPRLARCLARQEDPTKAHPQDRLPAGILYDEEGPFAYLKSDGLGTAVAFRSGTLRTEADTYNVPAGSIIDLAYGELKPPTRDNENTLYPEDPRLQILNDPRNTGLVSLRNAPIPTDASFLRFTTHYLPRIMRGIAGGNGAQHLEYNNPDTTLRQYVDAASGLTNTQLGRRVGALLARGKVVDL